MLLAAEILAVRPDSAGLLQNHDVLHEAPREFNLYFNGDANLQESSINSNTVRLIRSGGDGTFDDGNEIAVSLGYVGLVNPGSADPSQWQHVVMRPASNASHNAADAAVAFPDDYYRIEIIGSGDDPLVDRDGNAFASGTDFALQFRLDRGAQVVAVVPQPVQRQLDGSLSQAGNQIVVYFDNQRLNTVDAEDPKFYRLVDTASTLDSGDDATLLPTTATYDADNNAVTLTFAQTIPEGNYRLDIGSGGVDNQTLQTAVPIGTLFEGNTYTHNGFLGDRNGRSDDASDVDYFRVELTDDGSLHVDLQSHDAAFDGTIEILSGSGAVVAGPAASGPAGAASLVYDVPAGGDGEYYVRITSSDGSTGSYALDAEVVGTLVGIGDDNSTFDSATSLGVLGAAGTRVSAQIQPQTHVRLPAWPGGEDEPGHRQIQRELHIGAIGTESSVPQALPIVYYHFPATFANATNASQPYLNQITEEEKRISRTIFDVFASVTGYQFVETSGAGLAIGKTDLRAFDPTLGPNSGVAGLGGGAGAIVNAALYQDANRYFGDGFSGVMWHEIGHALGLGHAYDLPAMMGEGVPDDVLPGDHDTVHFQRIAPPNSTDIDLYQFELSEAGRFTAETVAQRLDVPSQLNTLLTLYRQNADGSREQIARNARYFGNDSFLELDLEPGTYFVAVTSIGNDQFDPNVPDSGYGGTTDGAYELKLDFQAARATALRDADGTVIDGSGDGSPGGIHQFWFQSSGDDDTTIFVDRANDPLLLGGVGDGGDGSLANPYDRLSKALTAAGTRIVLPQAGGIQLGDRFTISDGIGQTEFTFDTASGGLSIDVSAADLAAEIAAVVTAEMPTITATVNGRVVQFAHTAAGGSVQLDLTGTAALLNTPNLVRVVANGGGDGDITTGADNHPYLLGSDTSGNVLRDGESFLVPQGVNVMIDAGVLIKLREANLDAGTSSLGVSRAVSSIQVLGTPIAQVWLRSFHDDTMGGDTNGVGPTPGRGDFGGIVFRGDSDREDQGIFLNHVTHADIQHGGGRVTVDATESVYAPIHMVDARPAARFNYLHQNADSAMSANPNSFDDSLGRIGPQIVGNYLSNNTIDGLFIRIETALGGSLDKLTVFGRFDDTDIPHVLTENLLIEGNPGGLKLEGGQWDARAAGRLVIDPGVVLKVSGSRIEAERGASSLIAEGTANRPVIITALNDDRYGGSGSFDTDTSGFSTGTAGRWAGLYFGHLSSGSIDHALITFGGGLAPIEGTSRAFNVIEVHQASLRVANSTIRDNASGAASDVRNGRGANAAAAIYVRGSQPTLLSNTFINNAGPVASFDVNSLNYQVNSDPGRSTGLGDRLEQFADNYGPLIRLNQLSGNNINGIEIRGGELTTEGIWDDTDIVHVLRSEITVDNFHTYGGLTLQSSNTESLVVKLAGANAGFTATGTPTHIIDRIGGTIHVLGRPGFPVVLTHLNDDSVGAGFAPDGTPMTNTDNSATVSEGVVGGWRGFVFDQWSNDRNVAIVREAENPLTNGTDLNRIPGNAQPLGTLAPNQKSGDENRRLGFEVNGWISPDTPGDMDVYSFRGTAGTPVWIDIDRTASSLDLIVEVLTVNGAVLARSVLPSDPNDLESFNADPLTQNVVLGGDFFTHNFRDPGFYYVLPGAAGTTGTHYIRVRSNPQSSDIAQLDGKSSGNYQLQIRLQQVDEFPGSTVRYADIRFASTALDVQGLPHRSPLVGDAGDLEAPNQSGVNDSLDTAQQLVNLLHTDQAAISIAGSLANATDVDWYAFDIDITDVQTIGGVNDSPGSVGVVFDLDYADGATRADTTVAVYDAAGRLIWIGRESNITDDQPLDISGNADDLSRGSLGNKDAYIGPIQVEAAGRYYVAVMSNQQLPTALRSLYYNVAGDTHAGVRLEPIDTVQRVVEDHIGSTGYESWGFDRQPTTGALIDLANLDAHVTPFTLEDVALYVSTDVAGGDNGDHLYTVNPYRDERYTTRVSAGDGWQGGNNDIQDIVIRSDGRMFGVRQLIDTTNSVGALVEIAPDTGEILSTQNDNIPGRGTTPNVNLLNTNLGGAAARAEQFTTSDVVDAVTFQRRGTTGPASAPVPVYDTYLVVRETGTNAGQADSPLGTNSKLYRGRANGDATPAIAADGNPRYGVIGDIQPVGVTFASTTLTVSNNATDPAVTNIRIQSKIPGDAGNGITVNVNRLAGNTDVSVTVGSSGQTASINLILGGTGGPPFTAAPTAAQIVNAINNHAEARRYVTAVIVSGDNGTQAINTNQQSTAGNDGPHGPLAGRVTGISYSNFFSQGNLYGVTNAGEFLQINPNSGAAIVLNQLAGESFQGLTLGPQNVEGGAYANLLFAVTASGRLYAFNTDGEVQTIFADGDAPNPTVDSINIGGLSGSVTGLSFSPLDFNLWHPTTQRGEDAGHGINNTPNRSRNPGDVEYTVNTGAATRALDQAEGGISMQFGFETWNQNQASDQLRYLPTAAGVNAQHGIRQVAQHQDLSTNTTIGSTYNFPGGALGTLLTNGFSLAGSVAADRPTLYFNYFLETEQHGGSNRDSDVNDPFRDSARVFASRDGGDNWELLATNSSLLSGNDPTNAGQRAELPSFLSHLSDAGRASATPRAFDHQIVQQLMDGTGQWRQARIDLSTFAGVGEVLLRFDFSTAGAMDDPSLGQIDELYGEYSSAGNTPRSIRSTNNAFEGFYIDDIIVGYAERGEMVTAATPDSSILNLNGNRTNRNNLTYVEPVVLNGRYQLEIRRTDLLNISNIVSADISLEFESTDDAGIVIWQTFDTNDRHIPDWDAGGTGYNADLNRDRVQGMFIIEANTISDSGVRGINVQPGGSQGTPGSVTHPGATIQFVQVNRAQGLEQYDPDEGLVPGVVIQNNIIAGSSGIRFAGETSANPYAPVPFGRIVNNTLVGAGAGVGLQIDGTASPTVLNNILTGYDSAIAGNTSRSEIRSNYFQANGANGPTGFDPLVAAAGSPLFVAGTYYLAAGSRAIDSSLNSQQDRFDYVNFKDALAIPPSPIMAPDRDVYGQLRVDSDQSPGGGGSSVFKDRGAVDRADFDAPFAVLLDPVDNAVGGTDLDPNPTVVLLTDPISEGFSVLLADGRGPNSPFEGTGVNPATVTADTVTVRRNHGELVEGIDYTLGFNASTGEMRLTPQSTLWDPSGVYEIVLDNEVITDLAGNRLRANQPDGTTRFWIILPTVDFDFGDAPASYGTHLIDNGARHALLDEGNPRLGYGVDAEADSSGNDDLPGSLTIQSPTGSAIFQITGSGAATATITLSDTDAPAAGDQLTITSGVESHTFELVPMGIAPAGGNVAVRYSADDSAATIAGKLRDAIETRFDSAGYGLAISADANDEATILLENLDDEDGIGVGQLDGLGKLVFLRPDADGLVPESSADPADVLGFLNPLDPAGALVAVTVTGSGYLDGWIDWNNNGVFDPASEQVFHSVPVSDGINTLTIYAPPSATDGLRWARFRVSPEGNLQPTGLAIGGEVEDYRVEVIRVAVPEPEDDSYEMLEDNTIDTLAAGLDSVIANDTISPDLFTPFRVGVVRGPEHASSFELDPATGHFTYTPTADFVGQDTFTYVVGTQESAIGIDPDAIDIDVATVTIDIHPVNDRPVFTITNPYLEVAEDSDAQTHTDFVTEIAAGPATAVDELDGSQTYAFVVNALGFTPGGADDPFGAGYPQISETGELTYQALPDAFGVFEFEVLLVDSGANDPVRGDLNTSLPATITIQVQPINDAPQWVDPDSPILYESLEDQPLTMPVHGAGGIAGLLDNLAVGPDNEAADILPLLGGNQTLTIVSVPTATAENGVLEAIYDGDDNLIEIRYLPPQDFVGFDSFELDISDDGTTVDVGSGNEAYADPLSIRVTVTIDVLPVNDAPSFARGEDVQSVEDAGPVVVSNWATAIQVGPPTALDERTGAIVGDGKDDIAPQVPTFIITPLYDQWQTDFDHSTLFTRLPEAVIEGTNAHLHYEVAANGNGIAVFTAVVQDSGPADPSIGDVNRSEPVTFTITIQAINDPPEFTPGGDVEVLEDSGHYNQIWATDVRPGPADAADELAHQSVSFDVTTVTSLPGLFAPGAAPALDADGRLTFTPADDAAGTAVVTVIASDGVGGLSAPVTFTITVGEVNDPPIAGDLQYDGDEDTVLRVSVNDLLDAATEPDLITNPDETLSVAHLDSHSQLGAVISIDDAGRLLYDPRAVEVLQQLAPGQSLTDRFTYSLVDAAGEVSNVATITIEVAGINDAPVARPDTAVTTAGQTAVLLPLANDSDIDGTIDPDSIIITRQPAFGTLVVHSDGSMAYTPSAAYAGQDLIGYTVADNLGQQSEQTMITIQVAPPMIGEDFVIGGYLTGPIELDATEPIDADNLDRTSVEIVTPPQHGQVTVDDQAILRYQPDDGFIGTDSYQYRIFDHEGRASGIITITVNIVDSPAQNPVVFSDVNASGTVDPLDALLVLTRIGLARQEGVGILTAEMVADETPARFYDVDGNGRIEPLDALNVLNYLSHKVRGSGESPMVTPAIVVGAFTPALAPTAGEAITTVGEAITTAGDQPAVDLIFDASTAAEADFSPEFDYSLLAADAASQRQAELDDEERDLQAAVWDQLF